MRTDRISISSGTAITSAFLAGFGKEVWDNYRKNGTKFNNEDLIYTVIGGQTGSFVCMIIFDINKKKDKTSSQKHNGIFD